MTLTTPAESELSALTVAELRDLATVLQIEGRSSLRTKAELVSGIAAAQAAVEPLPEVVEPGVTPLPAVADPLPIAVDDLTSEVSTVVEVPQPEEVVPGLRPPPEQPEPEPVVEPEPEPVVVSPPEPPHGVFAELAVVDALVEVGDLAADVAAAVKAKIEAGEPVVVGESPHGDVADAVGHALIRRKVHGDPNRTEEGDNRHAEVMVEYEGSVQTERQRQVAENEAMDEERRARNVAARGR